MNVTKKIPSIKSTWASIKLFLSIFVPVTALVSSIVMFLYYKEINTSKTIFKTRENHLIDHFKEILLSDFNSAFSDLMFLSQQAKLQELLENIESGTRKGLAKEYLLFSKSKRLYDQIRFLNKNGMEIVRVNHNNGQPYIVPQDQLQSKAHRYYFKDTFQLHQSEIYLSPFDLNIEKGKIEQPLKPIIRIGTPVFDRNGQKGGIVMLNFLGMNLLKLLEKKEIYNSGQLLLLNSDGYWLKGRKTDEEWGFMFPDKKDRTFINTFPEAWQKISGTKSGQFYNAHGMFTFRTVHPLEELRSSPGFGKTFEPDAVQFDVKSYYWTMLSYVSSDILETRHQQIFLKFTGLYLLMLLLVSLASLFLTLFWFRRKAVETRFQTLIETAPSVILHLSPEGRILDFNPEAERIYGCKKEEALGKNYLELFVPEKAREGVVEDSKKVLSGNPTRGFENPIKSADGRWLIYSWDVDRIMGNSGYPTGVIAIGQDITNRKQIEEELRNNRENLRILVKERTSELSKVNNDLKFKIREIKQTEEILKQSEEKYRTLVEKMNDGLGIINEEGIITFVNDKLCQMFGYSKDEIIGSPVISFMDGDNQKIMEKQTALREKGAKEPFELKFTRKDGHQITTITAPELVFDKEGRFRGSFAIMTDITDRKKIEEQIKKSLKEKEVLLQEIHHRVKNNMQVISSLLNLQAKYIKDKHITEMFNESCNRIQSMALIHDKLYRSKNIGKIDFKDYINKLVHDLMSFYNVHTNKIALKIDADNISFGIDTAIPCGLIINELVSNSLKHGFSDGQKGEIKISLQLADQNEYELKISDNGNHFPEDLEFRNTETLGLRLVTSIVENQLDGKIELNKSEGTVFRVTFKEIEQKED